MGRGISQRLAISTVAINFRRSPVADKPAVNTAHRKSFFEWLNPGAAADAELDTAVAEMLNQDAEKRRRNAWLRKVGFVNRIFVYACLFGGWFFFEPEGESNITAKTAPLNLSSAILLRP